MYKDGSAFQSEWVQIQFEEHSPVQEVYGFSSTKGLITVEGVRYLPPVESRTLLVYMHPAATQTILAVPKAMARAGFHVLVAGSRYTRNDTPLIMEKVIRDLGAFITHARDQWDYRKIVLAGWSGGGSLALFYQSQAEHPTITQTPAGDPIDVKGFNLVPADAVAFHAAHYSRATILRDFIDPSVLDENDPDVRDHRLDIYDPRNPDQPPYSQDFMDHYRAAQLARIRRRTAWVKEMIEALRRKGGVETERIFVTHRTLADPRYLDVSIDPNDRHARMSFLGEPETVNNAPAGLARVSTLRSWLSQWSVDDTNVDALRNAAEITVPMLAIRNSGDDAVLGPQVERVFQVSTSRSKKFFNIEGANHYYADQPVHLQQVIQIYRDWLLAEGLYDGPQDYGGRSATSG